MGLGERIRQRREEARLTQVELARRAHISKGYLSELESESPEKPAPRPSAEVLYALATVLGTTVADLLGKEVRPASREIPASLREFAKMANLPEEDVRMLARIRFRGQQPDTPEDWRFLYDAIKRSIRGR